METWTRFNFATVTAHAASKRVWEGQDATGLALIRIFATSTSTYQIQVWNGSAFVDTGPTWSPGVHSTKHRYDMRVLATATGAIDIYMMSGSGSRILVVSVTGDFSLQAGVVRHKIVRLSAGLNNPSGIGGYLVQTDSTLNSFTESKPPTSTGTDTGGTGLFSDASETAFNDTTVISLPAAGDRRSLKAAARTATLAFVRGVTVSARLAYEVGGPTSVKPYLLIGGVRYYGTTFALSTVFQPFQFTWQTNPSTSAAWTTAQVNDATLEWGWEVV
ncbi:MAG: hypothetical protein WKF79_00420 [Nocardioides sp.]